MRTVTSAFVALCCTGCALVPPAIGQSGKGTISVTYYAPAWGPNTNDQEVVYFLKQVTVETATTEDSRIYFCSIKPDGTQRKEIAWLWKDKPEQFLEPYATAATMEVNAATKQAAIGVWEGEMSGIFVVGLDGKNFRSLWPKQWKQDRPTKVGTPTWSSDGKWLAFHEYRFEGGTNLYRIVKCKPDTSGYAALTERGGCNADPAWSPKGDLIAFVHYPKYYPGPRYLWLMNPEGNRQQHTKEWGGYPRWSPDGKNVLLEGILLIDAATAKRVTTAQKFPPVFPRWANAGFLEVIPGGINYTPSSGEGTQGLLKNVSRRGKTGNLDKEDLRW